MPAVVYINSTLAYKRKQKGTVADFVCPYCRQLFARRGINKHIGVKHPRKPQMTSAEKEQGGANKIAKPTEVAEVAEPVAAEPVAAEPVKVAEHELVEDFKRASTAMLTRLRLVLAQPEVAKPVKPVMVDESSMVGWTGYGTTLLMPCRNAAACPRRDTCHFYHGEKVMTAKPRSI